MKLPQLTTRQWAKNVVIWTKNFLNPEKFPQTASGRLDLFSCLWSRGDQSEGKWVVKEVTENFFLSRGKKDGQMLGLQFQGSVWPKILA